jgi:hypothetical protein
MLSFSKKYFRHKNSRHHFTVDLPMTCNHQEINTPGSSRTPTLQTQRNRIPRFSVKTAGTDAGTSPKDLTTKREKAHHPELRKWF